MMGFLRQSTASQTRIIGPFIDVTDFKTVETSLTLANTDCKLSKNGASAVNKNSGGGTHISNGNYAFTFDATDTDTVGELHVNVNQSANALPVVAKFTVLEEAVYDQLFAATAPGAATVAALATAQTDLDTLTGSDGVTLATSQPNYAPATVAELAKVPKSDGTVSWNATALAAINAEADTALSDYDPPTKAELDSGLAALNDPSAAVIADAVWDEARSGHTTSGSFGQGVASVQGNVTGSTASVSGAVGSVSGNVGGNVNGNVVGSVGSVSGAVGSVTGNVGGNVTGSVGSLATQAKADVNAEVVDALNTDTYAEPGQEAPGATVSLVKKIGYLYKAWRNKYTQTATEHALYSDDGSTVDQKATVADDDTTFTKGEMGTGP